MPKFSSDHQPPRRGKGPPPGSKPPSQDLADMRWVYEHPDPTTDPPGSPARANLQTLFADDFKGFLARKDRLEAQHLGPKSEGTHKSSPDSNESPEPEDVNSLKVEALIEDLITRSLEGVN